MNQTEEWRGDGIIKYRDSEYRVHNAWSVDPAVFVRYEPLDRRGRIIERKLGRESTIAMHVVMKFRNTVRKEKGSLSLTGPVR